MKFEDYLDPKSGKTPNEEFSAAIPKMLNDLVKEIEELKDYQEHLITHCNCDKK